MSDPNVPAVKSAIPTWTGSPVLDTAINQVVIVVGGLISGVLGVYLVKHGLGDETLLGVIPTAVPALLSSLVTLGFAIWSVVRKKQTVTAVVNHSLDAAVTGQVSDAVKALATPAQRAAIATAGK